MVTVFAVASIVLLSAAAAGGTVLLTGLSPTWAVLVVAAAATAAGIVWSGNVTVALLSGLVVTAPVAITKSISARGGVYAPGLELSVADVFLVALLGAWSVDLLLRRRRVRMPPPGVGVVLAIFAWAWVSALMAEDRIAGVLAAINQTKFLLEFVVVYNLVTTPAILRRTLVAGGIGLVLNLAMVVAQTVTGSVLAVQGAKASHLGVELVYATADGARAFRPSGFLLHPNPFADYLVIVLPLLFVFTLMSGTALPGRWRWASGGLACGGTLALILTLSRGGWVSFAVALGFALTSAVRRRLIPTRRIVLMGAAGAIGVVAVVLVQPAIVYRLTMDDDRSTQTRLVMMDQAALIIRDQPLFGVGLANYTRASHRYTPASFAPLPVGYQDTIRAGVVHNGYLLLWAERGLVGLLLHLSVFITALFRFWRLRTWADPALHAVALGLLAGVVGQGVFYVFDHFYLDLRPGVFWLLVALVAAALHMHAWPPRVPHLPQRAEVVA